MGMADAKDDLIDGLAAQRAELAVSIARARKAGELPDDVPDADVMANMMGELMPSSSEVAHRFWGLHDKSPQAATDFFYRLCCDAEYVRVAEVAKDLRWSSPTEWGDLQISINRSKPEKDPREIARAGIATTTHAEFPACRLCMENEGYPGRGYDDPAGYYPARGNLRIVPLELAGQRWGLQYSPYSYYPQHCIAMNSVHRPMHIDRECFEAMFDFVDLLPHYFIGSNADLPIVGGSILSHDHFQGGLHRFPMDEAPIAFEVHMQGYPSVQAGVLKWPTSVLQLKGDDRAAIIDCACHVLGSWRSYDDGHVGVVSQSDGAAHNTITPILRKEGDVYTLNLALRCNVTSVEHPLGVFHPHEELHHIKKENIGLIEVMGLAILPARLEREMDAVVQALLSGTDVRADALTAPHADWAEDVAARHSELSAENAWSILHVEIAAVFARVLETTGVFKWDESGIEAWGRFLGSL